MAQPPQQQQGMDLNQFIQSLGAVLDGYTPVEQANIIRQMLERRKAQNKKDARQIEPLIEQAIAYEEKVMQEQKEKDKIRNLLKDIGREEQKALESAHTALREVAKHINSLINEFKTLGLLEDDATKKLQKLDTMKKFLENIQSLSSAKVGTLELKEVKQSLNEILDFFEKFGYALKSLLRTLGYYANGSGGMAKLSQRLNDALNTLVYLNEAIEKIQKNEQDQLQKDIKLNKSTLEAKERRLKEKRFFIFNQVKWSARKKLTKEIEDLKKEIDEQEGEVADILAMNIIPLLEEFLQQYEILEEDATRLGLVVQDGSSTDDKFVQDLRSLKKAIQDFESGSNLKEIIEKLYTLLGVSARDENTLKQNMYSTMDVIRAIIPFADKLEKAKLEKLIGGINYYLQFMRAASKGTAPEA